MKLHSQQIEGNGEGSVRLTAQDKEDLFTLYNIIQKGDHVKISTKRNVKKGDKSEKVVLTMTLDIQDIEFEPTDESMRLRGKNLTQLEDVPLGSWHSAEITYNYPFTLHKEEWDNRSLELVHQACNLDAKAEVAAVVLQEGVAHLCLITENMTVLKEKIEKSVPKKRRGDSSAYDKAMEKFYTRCVESVQRVFDLEKLKAVILASPGFYAQGLYDRLFKDVSKRDNKVLFSNKDKFFVTHSSTGFIQGLDEVLKSEQVQKKLADTKYAKDVMAMEEFFQSLNADDLKAWYGPEECQKAVEMGAVKKLLLSDSLFRADDVNIRHKYAEMSELVKNSGGEVFIFSSLHESGQQLEQITGVAVLLKYPMDLDESDHEDEDDDDDDE